MAARKPLVINTGRIQQLQAGDTLDATVTEVDVVSKVAAATLIAGNIVYSSSATDVNKARANASGTVKPIGLAKTAITSGASRIIQTNGVLVLSTAEWDAAFGTTGGLTFNTIYYLSAATAGLGTVTAPSTVGEYVKQVGLGLSTTELLIMLEGPEVLL